MVFAVVAVTGLPGEDALAMLHIIEKLAFVIVAIRTGVFTPLSITVLHSLIKAADIRGLVIPLVLAKAIRFSQLICTSINITVHEDVRALPVL